MGVVTGLRVWLGGFGLKGLASRVWIKAGYIYRYIELASYVGNWAYTIAPFFFKYKY